MSETEIQNNIITCLKTFRWKVIRFNSGALNVGGRPLRFYRLTWRHPKDQSTGLSDLLAIKKGRIVWLEVKKPGEKQKDKQVLFESEMQEEGIEYYVVTSGVEALAILGEIK